MTQGRDKRRALQHGERRCDVCLRPTRKKSGPCYKCSVQTDSRRGGIKYTAQGTEEKQYDADQLEFLRAVDTLKSEVGPFPTWTQVLQMVLDLGYRKVQP